MCAEFPESLSLEERQFYEDNGYLIKRKSVPQWMIDRMNGHFSDVVSGKAPLGEGMALVKDIGVLKKVKSGELPPEYARGELVVYKVQGYFDNTFMEWVRWPDHVKIARCMAGSDAKSTHQYVSTSTPSHSVNHRLKPPLQHVH